MATKLRRVVLRTAAVLAGVVAVCLLLIALGLFPQEWLRGLVERQVRGVLGPGATIGQLHVVPGKLQAVATNVHVEGEGYHLEIGNLRIALALPTVFGKAFALRRVEMQRPVLTLDPSRPTGAASTETSAGLQKSVLVGNVKITDGSIIYKDAVYGDWRIDEVTIDGGIGKSSLHLKTGPPRWQRATTPVVFDRVRATLSIGPTLQTSVESLELGTGGSKITAKGDLGDIVTPNLNLKLQMTVDLADGALVPEAPPMTGRVNGTAQITGPMTDLQANAQMQGQGLVINAQRVDDASLTLAYKGERTQASLQATAIGGKITGKVDKNGARIDASAQASGLDLGRLAAASGTSGVSGEASMTATARGTDGGRIETAMQLDAQGHTAGALGFTAQAKVDGAVLGRRYEAALQWSASGSAEQPPSDTGAPTLKTLVWSAEGAANGVWPPKIGGRIGGEGRVLSPTRDSPFRVDGTIDSAGDVTSTLLQITGDLGRVHVAAQTNPRESSVDIAADDIRLERFLAQTSGLAHFSFRGAGPRGAFQGSGQGEIAALNWRDIALGTVGIEARSEGSANHATIRVPRLATNAEITVAPIAPRATDLQLSAHIELHDSPLAPFASFVEPSLTGRATATIDIRGPLASLAEAGEVQARVEALSVSTERLQASLQAPVDIQASPTRVVVSDLHATGKGFDLHVGGTFGVAANALMNAQIRGSVDFASLPLPPDTQVEGQARIDVALAGTRLRPRATGSVELEGLRAVTSQAPEIRVEAARLELTGESIRIPDATALVAGGRVRMNGTMPVAELLAPAGTRTTGGSIDVIWEGVDAGQIHAAAAPGSEVTIEGTLEGEAHLAVGSLASLQSLNGRVRTPPLAFRIDEVPVNVSGISVEIERGQAVLAPLELGTLQGALHVEGRADLVRRTMAGTTSGSLDLRALSPFLQGAALTGRTELNLEVKGPFAAPRPSGRMTLTDVTLRMREIQPAITDIDGALQIDDTQLRIGGITARWGGGPVTISGTSALNGTELRDVNVAIKGEGLALRYLDAKALVTASLKLTGRTGALRLGGDIDIQRGLYDKDIFFDASMRAPAVVKTEPSPFLSTLGLDLNVQTSQPFRVSNNIARVQARGRLTIRGTAADPAPIGRFTLTERGEVILQQQKFTIIRDQRRGTLEYDGTLDPQLDLEAMSKLRYRARSEAMEEMVVIADISGTLERPILQFREETEAEATAETTRRVVSIIATGREDPGSDGAWIVGEQAASLLAGRLSLGLSRQLQRLGLDQVTIEPNLIAQESDPSARLTFGKNLTSWSDLVYSIGLQDSEEPFFELHVSPLRNSGSRWFRDFGTYLRHGSSGETFGLNHRFRLGGGARRARPPSDETIAIKDVRVEGTLPVEETRVRGWLGTSAGSKRTFWDLQDDADKVRQRLVELGYIEAEVSARLDDGMAVFTVRAGAHYTWRVEGVSQPPDLTDTVRRAFYAEEALESGEQKLVVDLRGQGHLKARVLTRIEGDGAERTLVFVAEPGPVFAGADVVFEGAAAISQRALLKIAGGAGELLTQPARARQRLEEQYHRDFYLTASVGAPRIEESGNRVVIRVPVREGPRARIARVSFSGHTLPDSEVQPLAGGVVGSTPEELQTEEVLQAVRNHYFERGYSSVRMSARLLPRATDLELHIDVDEGQQITIREIAFEGSSRVPRSALERELPFHVGDPLDPRKLSHAESRLAKYDARARIASDPDDPTRVVIQLTPAPRLFADYSLEFTQHSAPGGAATVRAPNLVFGAITPGLTFSQSQFERTIRGWVRMPALFHSGLLNISVGQEKEDLVLGEERPPRGEESTDPEDLTHRTTGTATVLQELELGRRWRLQYGYNLRRVRQTIPGFPLPTVADIGRLQASLLRDTRDHVLDARRGRFWSFSVSYADEAFRSDVEFIKGYFQVSVYRPLNRHLTWAQAYRVGAARNPNGGQIYLSERFQAGGSTTLRGFASDAVGPLGVDGKVLPGDALLLLNQELRYRHKTGLGAAVFYDGGNVYARVQDIDLNLRHSIGAGLRYDSPIGLLRVDLGLPVSRRAQEDRYQIFLGIGQAF